MINVYGTIFIIALGCLGHFLYSWLHESKLAAFFFAVNESTWEHIKLAIGPSLLWMVVDYHFFFDNPNYFFAKFVALMSVIILIPVVYYSIRFITKKAILIVDIMEFVICVAFSQYLFSFVMNFNELDLFFRHIGIVGIVIIFLMVMTYTFAPEENFLFKDPITNKYGIEAHLHHTHK